jgi:hypothetical protein
MIFQDVPLIRAAIPGPHVNRAASPVPTACETMRRFARHRTTKSL